MKIPFESPYRQRYHDLLDQVFDSHFWSEGRMVEGFEEEFSSFVGGGVGAAAFSGGGLGLLALLEAAGVAGGEVIVPSNTFMATPLAARRAGGDVVFADCGRRDLCLTAETVAAKWTPRTKAVVVVHIGGHLAFEVEAIADLCRQRGAALIEDCAHAHGGSLNGRSAGTFGLGGVYSFYATKTMPLGEGGLVASTRPDVIEYVKKWRNYGKFDYQVDGFGARMNEVTAALGRVQLQRLPAILDFKRRLADKYDRVFTRRVELPPGMVSGYYKYIVFDTPLNEETGRVFDQPCHRLMKTGDRLPDTDWVAAHHACPPIYYGWDGADLSEIELADRLLA